VTALAVSTQPLAYRIEAVGSLEARETVVVPARVEGTLEALSFEEGQEVAPETVLAVVDGERYALEGERAEAGAAQADAALASARAQTAWERAALEEAEAILARRKALRAKDPGWVSEEEITSQEASVARVHASLEQRRAGEREAEAALAEARVRLAIARKNLADSHVRPPIAGKIESKHVAAGQYVKAGERIATIVDVSVLRLRFSVTESEAVALEVGQEVSFEVKPFPGKAFRARLVHLGATADPVTRMVECLAAAVEPDPALKPGFFATVQAETGRQERAIVVPEGAILPTERGFVAFTVEGGKAKRRALTLGLHTRDGGIEVLSGLEVGQTLAVRGAQALDEGVAVEVVPDEGPPASRPAGG
jgi:multidrug efflux system membrane fusion protein